MGHDQPQEAHHNGECQTHGTVVIKAHYLALLWMVTVLLNQMGLPEWRRERLKISENTPTSRWGQVLRNQLRSAAGPGVFHRFTLKKVDLSSVTIIHGCITEYPVLQLPLKQHDLLPAFLSTSRFSVQHFSIWLHSCLTKWKIHTAAWSYSWIQGNGGMHCIYNLWTWLKAKNNCFRHLLIQWTVEFYHEALRISK